MADQQLEDNKLPVRKWLRKHYIGPENTYFAICRHCSSKISYPNKYIRLYNHLREKHLKVLTDQQKRDNNVHWTWDYFILKSDKKVQCIMCSKIINSKRYDHLVCHLKTHRSKYIFFNPKPDIDIDDVSSNTSGGKECRTLGSLTTNSF